MEKKYLSIEMKGDNQIITDGMAIKAEKGVSIKSRSEKTGSFSIYAGGGQIQAIKVTFHFANCYSIS